MNLNEHLILWNKIQQFAFDEPNAEITFSKKLASQQKWSASYTQRVIEEYRRFIFLCCISPNGAAPSKAVDEAWHLHLTYTRSYWDAFCKNTLGKDIHHYPSGGGEQEDHKHLNWYNETLSLYQSVFGEQPPADIWPRPAKQTAASLWEHVRPYLLISKGTLLAIVLLLLLPFGITYLITGIASPYLLNGPLFLQYYAILCITALIAFYLYRNDKIMRMGNIVNVWPLNNANIFQLTHLVHGKERAIQTCLLDLYRRGIVSVDDKRRILIHRSNYLAPEKEENPFVPALLAEADGSSVPYSFIADTWYKRQLFEHSGIGQLQYFNNYKETWLQKNWVLLIVFLIGLARIIQGVINSRPVGFLILEIIGFIILSMVMSSYLTTANVIKNKLQQLLVYKAGGKQLYADDIVNDYAVNGKRVLEWLPATLMLAPMIALFPALPVKPAGRTIWGGGGYTCSGSSGGGGGSSVGGGGGCGGCGGNN
ncbi:hypothetical protein [Niastella sp. OAS944]|uniref:hypothetical protein n=1 Tax=Niastella sp. OAS944 TaxID=2664089 RepID=UPI00349322AE|nr:putative membrane protein YgcG [Chitinophagaceae bacterium OAS944]